MPRRDPYRKRLQNLLNSEALKTLERIRSTKETPEEIRSTVETPEEIEEIRSFIADYAPRGRAEKLMKLRESLDHEEQTLLILRVDKAMPWEEVAEVMRADSEPATLAALRERFERLKEKLGRLAREQGLIE
jgi:RNA polymerase sigma-70 factor (ECF subfamily)